MMENYDKRAEFWSDMKRLDYKDRWINNDMWNLLRHGLIFEGQDVLEIGPGIGRQYEVFRPFARSYAVADISDSVLSLYKNKSTERIKIGNWSGKYKDGFDIIHFWFVIHHILKSEAGDFLRFVMMNLRKDGMIIFNAPTGENATRFKEDGMKTTPWEKDEVYNLFHKAGFSTPAGRYKYNGNELFIMEKTYGREI